MRSAGVGKGVGVAGECGGEPLALALLRFFKARVKRPVGDTLVAFLFLLLVLSDSDASSAKSLTGDSEPLLILLVSSGLGVPVDG